MRLRSHLLVGLAAGSLFLLACGSDSSDSSGDDGGTPPVGGTGGSKSGGAKSGGSAGTGQGGKATGGSGQGGSGQGGKATGGSGQGGKESGGSGQGGKESGGNTQAGGHTAGGGVTGGTTGSGGKAAGGGEQGGSTQQGGSGQGGNTQSGGMTGTGGSPDLSDSIVPSTCDEAHGTAGCCGPDGNVYFYKESTQSIRLTKCTGGQVCTWDTTKNFYHCATGVAATGDPSGTYPLICGGAPVAGACDATGAGGTTGSGGAGGTTGTGGSGGTTGTGGKGGSTGTGGTTGAGGGTTGPVCGGFAFTDDDCGTCLQTSCCTEAGTCKADDTCYACAGDPTTSGCDADTAYGGLTACANTSCATQCFKPPTCDQIWQAGDCGTCLTNNCCDASETCAADQTCISCFGDTPGPNCDTTSANYAAMTQCAGNFCSDVCGGGGPANTPCESDDDCAGTAGTTCDPATKTCQPACTISPDSCDESAGLACLGATGATTGACYELCSVSNGNTCDGGTLTCYPALSNGEGFCLNAGTGKTGQACGTNTGVTIGCVAGDTCVNEGTDAGGNEKDICQPICDFYGTPVCPAGDVCVNGDFCVPKSLIGTVSPAAVGATCTSAAATANELCGAKGSGTSLHYQGQCVFDSGTSGTAHCVEYCDATGDNPASTCPAGKTCQAASADGSDPSFGGCF